MKSKNTVKVLSWLAFFVALIVLSIWYWQHTIDYPSTDDAYVQANIVNISSQVSGRVLTVFVKNNQMVKAGTPLFKIDPRPFNIALKNAQAELDLAKQAVGAATDAVQVARSVVVQRQAQLDNTMLSYRRTFTLYKKGIDSKAQADQATAELAVAKANLKAANNELQQALHKQGSLGNSNAQIRQAQSAVDKAKLNLAYTLVKAPSDGHIANFTLRPGDSIAAGQSLFAFIDNHTWWVDANFKETQLKRLRKGQSAEIVIDTYPDHTFRGKINSISRGSGASFSLLPPENATGNWVKVIQRFPVKVMFVHPDTKRYQLRVGASSTVTINTLTTSK